MSFTAAEQDFLRAQPIGRLSTIGPGGQPQIRPVGVHLGPDGTIDVVGHALASTQKWRNVIANPKVAFIVDEVHSVVPPRAQGIEIRGTAQITGDTIRITPSRVITWGIDGEGTRARNV